MTPQKFIQEKTLVMPIGQRKEYSILKTPNWLTKSITCMVACSFGMPQTSFANQPAGRPQAAAESTAARPLDVRLGAEGELNGVVRDAQGRVQPGVAVAVFHDGNEIATTQTDAEGQFSVGGLRRGNHVILAQRTENPVRLWPENAAPPQAVQTPVITADEEYVEPTSEVVQVQQRSYGQARPRRSRVGAHISRCFANYPLLATTALIGAGIGAGIAIGSNGRPASP
jgi:hypothetical protein